MRYLSKFEKFFETKINLNKREIIHSIIDEEVENSHQKFNLKISDDDVLLEKEKLTDVILMIWDDIENANNREYQELMNFVFNGVEKVLPIRKYYEMGKKDYKVHVSCVIYKIFMVINNKLYNQYDKKIVESLKSEYFKNTIEDLLLEIIEKHNLNFEVGFREDDFNIYSFILKLNEDPSIITDEYSNKIDIMYEDIVNKKPRIERFFPEYDIEIGRKLLYNPMDFSRVLVIIISLTPKKTNESVEYKETIEDCFTQFCDDYDLDISIDEGHLVNGSYVPGKLLPDIIEYAKKYNTEIQIKDCYRITFIPKTHRHSHELTEFGERWKESINNDFRSAIDKMNKLSGIKLDGKIPEIKPSFWTLTIYAVN